MEQFSSSGDEIIAYFNKTLGTINVGTFEEKLKEFVSNTISLRAEHSSFERALGCGDTLLQGGTLSDLLGKAQAEITRCRIVRLEAKIATTHQASSKSKAGRMVKYCNEFTSDEKKLREALNSTQLVDEPAKVVHNSIWKFVTDAKA